MRVRSLRLGDVRCVAEAQLFPADGINWICGENGAGKTSVLESLSLLSTGRTFRHSAVDGVIRRGALNATVFAEVLDEISGALNRVGIDRSRRLFRARVDGQDVATLAGLFQRCPVLCVEPDCGGLILGPGEFRRRFLDWSLFHVEPEFFPSWRRYQRALKQRNALLRQGGSAAELRAWDDEFIDAGMRLHHFREQHLAEMSAAFTAEAAWLLPGLGAPSWRYRPGWAANQDSLDSALDAARPSDRRMGFSTVGPHRGGWAVTYSSVPTRESFSRGQAKATALALYLAQAQLFRQRRTQFPVLCLDDVLSELDRGRQSRLVETLRRLGLQVLLSVPVVPEGSDRSMSDATFHVEQGVVTRQV